MEKELDQIFIGNMKLYVNLPKYRRTGYTQQGGALLEGGKGEYQHTHVQVQPKGKEEWRVIKGKEARRDHIMKHTYVEAVRKPPQDQWKGPSIETTLKVLPWMSNSIVGRMVPDLNFTSLCEEFIKGGMSMIKVRYMGDNLVLLSPKEGERMEDIIKLNNRWFTSMFEDLELWFVSCVVDHRLAWARCYGIPIPLWNKDCLSKVVGEVAEMVSFDEATEQWENIEYARIQIRVSKSCRVEVSKGYQINGQIYNICIIEKEPSQGGGACNCLEHNYASSDSISSMDTFIEETIFSDKASKDGDVNVGGTSR